MKERNAREKTGKGYDVGPHCLLLSAVDCSGSTAVVVETATACVAVDPGLC